MDRSLYGRGEVIPCMNFSCATGFIHNIERIEGGRISFELWGEVVDSLDSEDRYFIFGEPNRFFLLDRIYVIPEFPVGGDGERCLEEKRLVSVVYRSFLENGKPLEVLLKAEEPNVENEVLMVEHLSKSIENRVTPERFWLNKIIRALCFNRGFLE